MGANEAAVRSQSIVNRVKGIPLKPKEEWPIIADEKAGLARPMLSYVAIIAAIPVVAQLIGSLVLGYLLLVITYRPPIVAALGAAIGLYILSLIAVVVIALMIDALAPKFGGSKNRFRRSRSRPTAARPRGSLGRRPWFLRSGFSPSWAFTASIFSIWGCRS